MDLGIAKNAREERIRARDSKARDGKAGNSQAAAPSGADQLKQDAENARMAQLYRQHVLGEKPPEGGMVSIGDIRPASNNAASPINRRRPESEPVAGD
jgi:7,8-dihydro-6-hydroxymethylpterin dimethyltransferase